ncbi:IniB N-terminal domain-containing protein [Actinomycetospora sp. OC33-EN08]|uniref:IniB N-terminal domain-containing protein n=1 Tax=Actinomycetospora aurantiaca TaxID=3129233 RepID=A0ABU8MHA8_9PSEU
MPATEAKTLLQFLLDLLRDPQTQAEFDQNPQATLAAAGLDGMCFADVRDALPLVMDHAPASVAARYDDDVRAASASAVAVVGEEHHHHGGGGEHHWIPGPVLPPHTPEVEKVIQQLQYVTNNYAYDSHDTNFETNLEQNIRANGDVTTTLDIDPTVASGDGAVAVGGDNSAPIATDGAVAGDGNMINGDGTAAFGDGDATSVGGSIGADNGGAVSLTDAATGENTDESATNFGSGAASSQGDATPDNSETETISVTDESDNSDNSDNSVNDSNNETSTETTTETDESISDSVFSDGGPITAADEDGLDALDD